MADKKGRVAQIIKKDLTDIILYELKSPVVKFSSLNRVEVTSDYSYCKVYISDLDPNKTDSIVAFLNNNSKKIRSMLAKKLDIYKTPALIFVADKDYEKCGSQKSICRLTFSLFFVTLICKLKVTPDFVRGYELFNQHTT